MANIIPLDNVQLPAHLMGRTAVNDVFAAGLPQGGGFPTIGIKGTRFVVKADGTDTVLNSLDIAVVLISAKPNLDKAYYATKFDPNNTEVKSPDCFSKDGVRPDAASTLKQHDSCAGCAMNQFGSGVSADGSPSKGKACADTKMLAIYANNGVYGFKIPPASLKAFTNYVKETSRRGIDLSTAITVVGFDANFTFPVLTFNFGGFLGAEQVAKIDALKGSPEVADIVGGTHSAAPQVAYTPAPAAPAPPVVEVASPFAEQAPTPAAKTRASRAKKEEAPPAATLATPAAPAAEPVAVSQADAEAELRALLGL